MALKGGRRGGEEKSLFEFRMIRALITIVKSKKPLRNHAKSHLIWSKFVFNGHSFFSSTCEFSNLLKPIYWLLDIWICAFFHSFAFIFIVSFYWITLNGVSVLCACLIWTWLSHLVHYLVTRVLPFYSIKLSVFVLISCMVVSCIDFTLFEQSKGVRILLLFCRLSMNAPISV